MKFQTEVSSVVTRILSSLKNKKNKTMHFFNIYVNAIHFVPSSVTLVFTSRTIHCSSIIPNYLSNESSLISDDTSRENKDTNAMDQKRVPLVIASSSRHTCNTIQFVNRLSFDSLKRSQMQKIFSSTTLACCEYLRTLEIRDVHNFLIDLKPIIRHCERLKNLLIGGLTEKQLIGQLASEKPAQRFEDENGTLMSTTDPTFEHNITRLKLEIDLNFLNIKKVTDVLTKFLHHFGLSALRPMTHLNLSFTSSHEDPDYQIPLNLEPIMKVIHDTPTLSRNLQSLKLDTSIFSVENFGVNKHISSLPKLAVLNLHGLEQPRGGVRSRIIQKVSNSKEDNIFDPTSIHQAEKMDEGNDDDDHTDKTSSVQFFPSLREFHVTHPQHINQFVATFSENDDDNEIAKSSSHFFVKQLYSFHFEVDVNPIQSLPGYRFIFRNLLAKQMKENLRHLVIQTKGTHDTHSSVRSRLVTDFNPFDALSELTSLSHLKLIVNHSEVRDGIGLLPKGKAPPFLRTLEIDSGIMPLDFHGENGIPRQICEYMPEEENTSTSSSSSLEELCFKGSTFDLFPDMLKSLFHPTRCSFRKSLRTLKVSLFQMETFNLVQVEDFEHLANCFAESNKLEVLHLNCYPHSLAPTTVNAENYNEILQDGIKKHLSRLRSSLKEVRICQVPPSSANNDDSFVDHFLHSEECAKDAPIPKDYLDAIFLS